MIKRLFFGVVVHLDDLGHHGRFRQLQTLAETNLREIKRLTYSRNITQAILLSRQNLSQDTSHDLAAASLGQVLDDVDRLGGGKGSDGLADLQHQLLADGLRISAAGLEGDKGVDGLASEFIADADDGGFGDRVCKESARYSRLSLLKTYCAREEQPQSQRSTDGGQRRSRRRQHVL